MPFEIVPSDDSILLTYTKMRAVLELKGQKIGYNDTIIAATFLAKNGILAFSVKTGQSDKKKRPPISEKPSCFLVLTPEYHHREDWKNA